MQLSFFNTINPKGEELTQARETLSKQEQRVLQIMRGKESMTPFEVIVTYNRWFKPIPITSIRRCMTVLTEKGRLEKLDEMKEGNYGKPNHKWRIK
jgi:hypothetical protein